MKLQWITFAVMLSGSIAGCSDQTKNTTNISPPSVEDHGVNENATAEVKAKEDAGEEGGEEAGNVASSSAAGISSSVKDTVDTPAVVFGDRFPEVQDVKVTPARNGQWRFAVTLSSTYDTPQRYADGWRVLDAQGQELGIRVLGHDHASEQPFTRSGSIQVPNETDTVFVEGRDQANGWSGQRFKVEMPDRK